MPDRIEKIGYSIASHISNVTLERIKITRMILNFKISKNDQINFLWCSSLRIDDTGEKKQSKLGADSFDASKVKLHVPEYINLFKYNVAGKPIKPVKNMKCLNCLKIQGW